MPDDALAGVVACDASSLDISAVLAENTQLRLRIEALERELEFLRTHPTLAAGIRGERIISGLVAGERTLRNAPADFVSDDGQLIEVKYAQLNIKYAGQSIKRWVWGKIFGEGGLKKFDHLLLIGKAEHAARHKYADPDSPVVMFCVPFDEVAPMTTTVNGGRYRAIFLMSDPDRARRSLSAPLFTKYQITKQELQQRFGTCSR